MTTEFSVNLVAFGDTAGLGLWLDGHYRQHLRYNAVLAAQVPAVIINVYPILNMGTNEREVRLWLDAHETWHELIRPLANVTGINLANIDFDDVTAWYEWQDVHNSEHRLLDTAFGVA